MNKIYLQYMYSYPHKSAYRPVAGELVERHLAVLAGQPAGLYVHIPFCRSKCGYCNLFSLANPAESLIDAYLEAVDRQMCQFDQVVGLRTVHFDSLVLGGGTPALLPVAQLDALLTGIEQRTGVTPDNVRSVIELSPASVGEEMVAYLADKGFTRVSMGAQSFVEAELARIGRAEPPAAVCEAMERLRGRFPVCNLDLIYGIPGQTRESLRYSLESTVEYRPEEVFLYPLYTRDHTSLAGTAIDEERQLELYRVGRDFLLGAGYRQISMRRFALRMDEGGVDCGFGRCLSLGCGGRSYLGDLHVCEPYSARAEKVRAGLGRFVDKDDFLSGLTGYLLDEDEHRRRYAVKNLLHVWGIGINDYKRRFGGDPEEDFPFLADLDAEGLLARNAGRLRLTGEGLARSDAIGPLFVSPMVKAQSRTA